MWNRIEEILSGFKPLFSRVSAYAQHVVIVIGLMIRSDKLGLTSVIRDLALRPETYEPMLHFFRSDAWDLERVRSKWAEIVGEKFPLFEKAGHCFLVGDGTKQAKEGRHMPGVKKLAQESETQSKPGYLHGHHWGCAGVLIGREKTLSCVLLSARIHDGLQAEGAQDSSGMPLLDLENPPVIFHLALNGLEQNSDGLYTAEALQGRFDEAINAYDQITEGFTDYVLEIEAEEIAVAE